MKPNATIKFDCQHCNKLVSFTRKNLEAGKCGACGHPLSADDREKINSALLDFEGRQLVSILSR
jgi:transcription initiation factor IIE alpha subunit